MTRRFRTASTLPIPRPVLRPEEAVDEAAPMPAGAGPRCLVCQRSTPQVQICARCLARLTVPAGMASEQIASRNAGSAPTRLIDTWGNHHALAAHTLIGRGIGIDLQILHGTISRTHASLMRSGHGWWLTDLTSINGTSLDGAPLDRPAAVQTGQRVAFAEVAFYFVDVPLETLPEAPLLRHATLPLHVAPPLPAAVIAEQPLLELIETPTIGGLLMAAGHRPVVLTWMQLELLRALVQRWTRDRLAPAAARGFVATSELLVAIPWDAVDPTPDNLKQLVRRVRQLLVEAGDDVELESRRSKGYRLRRRPPR